MDRLADPRRYAGERAQSPDDLDAMLRASDERSAHARALKLRDELAARLDAGQEGEIRAGLAAMPDASHYRVYWQALARALEAPAIDSSQQGVVAETFAVPLVLVAAASQAQSIPGVLADIGAVQALFEGARAFGPARSFGLSNRLCTLDALEALSLVAIYRARRTLDASVLERSLPAMETTIAPGREQAHLRFLIGAGIRPANAPGFGETAAHIGAWGMELSRLIGVQLATPGTQLLVLPRPPKGLLDAPQAGRCAQLDVALELFVSNTVRRFRSAAGDPIAVLSTHDDEELRLTLSSPFAEDLIEGFRRPLSRLDDLRALQDQIVQLLSAVRLREVRIIGEVLPSVSAAGCLWFPRFDEPRSLRF